jgi:hypothetical protein
MFCKSLVLSKEFTPGRLELSTDGSTATKRSDTPSLRPSASQLDHEDIALGFVELVHEPAVCGLKRQFCRAGINLHSSSTAAVIRSKLIPQLTAGKPLFQMVPGTSPFGGGFVARGLQFFGSEDVAGDWNDGGCQSIGWLSEEGLKSLMVLLGGNPSRIKPPLLPGRHAATPFSVHPSVVLPRMLCRQ